MTAKLRPWHLSLATAAMLLATGAPAFAAAPAAPVPIGANQAFLGAVNGVEVNATVKMACFGPVFPGQTGHPMDGQTVSVRLVPVPVIGRVPGYTGSAANRIGAGFGLASVATFPMELSAYGVGAKIPNTLTLPCYGTGTVTFTPTPTSATARSTTVSVTFVGQP